MEIKEIAKRNYDANVRRGQISDDSAIFDFIAKIDEEKRELIYSIGNKYSAGKPPFDPQELADIALVFFSMAEHYGIDLVKEMELKMLKNEERND
jgi:hypothetical protein